MGLKPSTFDRTRAGEWCVKGVIRSNLHKQVQTYSCNVVLV
jgi:hypothetical protein